MNESSPSPVPATIPASVDEAWSTRANHFNVNLPDVGSGIQRTSGTYIATLAALEGTRAESLQVLADAAALLGITGLEIDHAQSLGEVTGCGDEEPMQRYQERASELFEDARQRFPGCFPQA